MLRKYILFVLVNPDKFISKSFEAPICRGGYVAGCQVRMAVCARVRVRVCVCVCGVLVGAGINVCVKPSNSLFLKKMSSPVPYVYNVLNKFGRIE